MIRTSTLVWLGLAIVMGSGLFYLKYEVQDLEQSLVRLNTEVRDNKQALHVLRAEWSYLNQPDRLARLSRRYLDLVALAPERITTLADLPPIMDGRERARSSPRANGPAARPRAHP